MNLYLNELYQKAFKSYDKLHWDTSFEINDGIHFTSINSFLYERGDDIHLDYYRDFEIAFPYKINLCQSLLNYYHSISFNSNDYLNMAIQKFHHISESENAVSMIIGIMNLDKDLLLALQSNQFVIKRCSTVMIKDLCLSDMEDIALALPKKKRDKLRNIRKKIIESGIVVNRCPISSDDMNKLLDITLIDKDPRRLLTPKSYVENIILYLKPDFFIAKDKNIIIGALIAKRIDDDYYILFSAHSGKDSLNKFHQSYLLFDQAISYAAQIGCKRVHGGRDPYTFKKNFGFKPQPIFWAAKGSTLDQNKVIEKWLPYLTKRHLEKYKGEGI